MSSFSCPRPWHGDHWDILLCWMKNHFGRSCGDIQMVPGEAKCCQGDPDWRGEGRNERWGGGQYRSARRGMVVTLSTSYTRLLAHLSVICCSGQNEPRRPYTLLLTRELVGILRQGASGLGLRTALPLGLSFRNHYFQTSFSSNI